MRLNAVPSTSIRDCGHHDPRLRFEKRIEVQLRLLINHSTNPAPITRLDIWSKPHT